MRKKFLIFSAIVFFAILVFALFINSYYRVVGLNNSPIQTSAGIQIDAPKANEKIASPLTIKGIVNGNGWTGFEGQVGTVRLFDQDGKELALGILTATGDWMQLPTNFETKLFFDYTGENPGKLVFYNENASGEPERNKTFELPVVLTTSSSERSKVKVYFNNGQFDPEYTCSNVFAVEREIPKTPAIARAAVEELLKGPTDLEKNAGFITNINPHVTINSLAIENGVARIDFDSQLENQVAGSCRVLAIRAQITETLKQFLTVREVVISINGKTEDILQP